MNIISKIAATATVLTLFSTATFAEEKHFDGLYNGADIGVAGDIGSEIGITGGSNYFYSAHVGIRRQTESNFVFGAEATFGDYSTSSSTPFLNYTVKSGIDYTWSLAGYMGYAFGNTKRNLLKVGAAYNTIHTFSKFSTNHDTRNINDVRAFIGYERVLTGGWHLRTSLDYLKANSTDSAQASLGFAYQF